MRIAHEVHEVVEVHAKLVGPGEVVRRLRKTGHRVDPRAASRKPIEGLKLLIFEQLVFEVVGDALRTAVQHAIDLESEIRAAVLERDHRGGLVKPVGRDHANRQPMARFREPHLLAQDRIFDLLESITHRAISGSDGAGTSDGARRYE